MNQLDISIKEPDTKLETEKKIEKETEVDVSRKNSQKSIQSTIKSRSNFTNADMHKDAVSKLEDTEKLMTSQVIFII